MSNTHGHHWITDRKRLSIYRAHGWRCGYCARRVTRRYGCSAKFAGRLVNWQFASHGAKVYASSFDAPQQHR